MRKEKYLSKLQTNCITLRQLKGSRNSTILSFLPMTDWDAAGAQILGEDISASKTKLLMFLRMQWSGGADMSEILDFIVSTIIDLFVIGSFVLSMRELYRKGAVLLACILGILYNVAIMILTVSGPRITFIVASILFITFTVKLISHKL